VLPSLFRKKSGPTGCDEKLELPDGDFLELEWHRALGTERAEELVILSHGLEGSTASSYMAGLALSLTSAGHDVLAWNMRGCGRERNRLPTWYHSGQSSDLRMVVRHAREVRPTQRITLVGVSVGGNIVCKYLGEEGKNLAAAVQRAITISAPLDLRGSAETLARPSRAPYMRYLLRPLRSRIRDKAARFPSLFDVQGLDSIRNFYEFDRRFTAPMHGFASVEEYWNSCSGIRFLEHITIPTHIITASDDPFLSPECYPIKIARCSQLIFLETPRHGGHVGFIDSLNLSSTWLERRILEILALQDNGAACIANS
jgi:predicted alpha/beta-fold hydrolase